MASPVISRFTVGPLRRNEITLARPSPHYNPEQETLLAGTAETTRDLSPLPGGGAILSGFPESLRLLQRGLQGEQLLRELGPVLMIATGRRVAISE